ncbi:Uma2 family endonuclease [Streptomyces malaysiensis]|uniref:Uma2 family endonuclease n=1 Tax=Streptomyces malaysiensis subsp. samsunensis TaxID=459658 RepID=A0A9X2RT48_STRMQ|nr:Uma2 family endonuclease [Streptomyces samsunensis]MCQ8829363.1 Uma2 family endonuclease [Streptomyces samsunensis]
MSAAHEYGLDEQYGQCEWPRPPQGGWTADDLDRLPNLPPHTELIDGSLVLVSPQAAFHARVMKLLQIALANQAPVESEVLPEMSIRLDEKNQLEPDVLVTRAYEFLDAYQTWYGPQQILLAVEVVSPDSKERDREVKPRKYAGVGIPHFWRVEEDGGLPIVYVYELDPAAKAYQPTGIYHDKLRLTVPFPIEIDLTAINRRRP